MYLDSLCIPALIELQFEAAFAAFHGDQAQQRCELLLVLGGNACGGEKYGMVPVCPGAFAFKPQRTLNGAQVGMDRSAFAIERGRCSMRWRT